MKRAVRMFAQPQLEALRRSLGDSVFDVVLKVNRLSRRQAGPGDALIVPEGDFTFLDLSPFPPRLAVARGQAKLLVVSLRAQAFAAHEGGALTRWGPVSSGRREFPTPSGLYHTNWKSRERRSSVDEEWLMCWYWNIDSRLHVSIHAYDPHGSRPPWARLPENPSAASVSAEEIAAALPPPPFSPSSSSRRSSRYSDSRRPGSRSGASCSPTPPS